jgi:hypothetical protein
VADSATPTRDGPGAYVVTYEDGDVSERRVAVGQSF